MSQPDHKASTLIVGRFVDPAELAPDAVRALLVCPLPTNGEDGKPLFQAQVIFHDGMMHPLAAPDNNLDVRSYCQRLSALYDWPVHDGLPVSEHYPRGKDEITASPQLNQNERKAMQLIGEKIADQLEASNIPFSQAVDQARDQLAAFVAFSVVEGGLDREAAKEAALEALNATVQKLVK
ncbi:hypothetical protein [Acetobacter aceti]|uniref:Uncharacterized protein n=1 Tax=Acetobacter aceti TaxID=435 RepID=A0A6S6PV82_ACEAC|nr:hypothetical protein [Acetobacter aceti]BCI68944.1 hypothetical protein AAJCM20276_35680 [Acetobacter aceti]